MVLDCQLEIRESDGDECSDYDENDEHDEQNAVDSVNLVPPDAGKDVEELDVDRTERKKSCHTHLNITKVPQRNVSKTATGLKIASPIFIRLIGEPIQRPRHADNHKVPTTGVLLEYFLS